MYGYTDSDWAGDKETRRSVTGYIFMFAGGAVSWQAKRLPIITFSSTEGEYYDLTNAAREAAFLRKLLTDLKYNDNSNAANCTVIYGDNQGSLAMAENPEDHKRAKHIEVQWHFIREQVEAEKVKLYFIPSNEMAADGLTKPLNDVKHQAFVQLCGLHEV